MKIRSSLILFVLLLPAFCQAQDLNRKILMTVGNNKVEAGEFIRMYKKSLEPGKALDVNDYLQQYIIFKLKVSDAIKEGYDTTRAFRNELKGYRSQLAQDYLTDTLAKEKLLKKAYQRSLIEINAWHILIALPADASPEDTLKAWKKAVDIRERIQKGESFEQVARGTSDDPSVKVNGGNLGYFTVFQMIMPFEDAAYSMKKGEISEPVRTPYGYHIIKVADIRPSKGKILVAHIMKAVPPGTDEEKAKLAEEEIDTIYNKLRKGASFADLARKYSDHKASAVKGGELNWFGAGEIISDFSEAAFSISDTGEYTRPVRTVYGWHIIKLLGRKEPGSYKDSKSYLESKINKSYLNSLSKKAFIENLKKEYNFMINKTAYNWFIINTDTLIIQGKKKYDRSNIPETDLYSFADQHFKTDEFADYIERRGSIKSTKDSVAFINHSIEENAYENILAYENSILEKKYPEFRYLMNEFHDGILLFDVSEKKVWNRVTNDSLGLQQFYNDHKNNYLTREGIEAEIYTLKSPEKQKELLSAYKKYSKKKDPDKLLSEKFNRNNDTLLLIENGKWYKGDDSELDRLNWVTGSQSFSRKGYPAIILINKILVPEPEEFDKIKGKIMTDYQDFLETEWRRQLKENYPVLIDNSVLDEVRKKLNNE
jgi:peptidyl-prolyl cis-trans isomerase SurA